MIDALGRYRIVAELGQGAMGVVYKAVDPVIDRTVAIKTINLNLSRQELEEYQARFQQEIKAAGRLNHPNIVTIYDVGRTEKVAYMAMEFLEGRELKDIIASGRLPGPETIVDIVAQVADGLWFAHQQGIVHRDVKPSNIMVLKGGIAKITDFGIARLPDSPVKTLTGLILGSPRYMSPEQVIGKAIDSRTDIFSLGVVLYEALTGVPPFDGDNVNAIMYATVNSAPPPPSTHNPVIPAMLDLIVAKAMAKAVEERYQTIEEFAGDLREVLRQFHADRPTVALKARAAPPPGPARAEPTSPDETTLPLGREPRRDRASPRDEEPARPYALDKSFDSFDATLRLAAMTDQTADFEDYITSTQKMRAYRGRIETSAPLPDGSPASAHPAPPPPRQGAAPGGAETPARRPGLLVAVIATLALAAAALVARLLAG